MIQAAVIHNIHGTLSYSYAVRATFELEFLDGVSQNQLNSLAWIALTVHVLSKDEPHKVPVASYPKHDEVIIPIDEETESKDCSFLINLN